MCEQQQVEIEAQQAAVGVAQARLRPFGIIHQVIGDEAEFVTARPAHDTIGAPRAHHDSATAATASHSPEPNHSPEASESPKASESPEATHSAKASESHEASESEHASATSTASLDANAAFGLCQAWSNADKHHLDGLVGFRAKLAVLAGGVANIRTFCASVKHTDGDHHDGQLPSSSVSPTASTTGDAHHGHDGHGGSAKFPVPSPAPQVGGHN